MIVSALMLWLLSFVTWVISKLPDTPSFSIISTAVHAANSYITSVAQVFPIVTLVAIVAFVVVFDLVLIGYKVIKWVYKKVPGIN